MHQHSQDSVRELTHLDHNGSARMVDVSSKSITQRIARASAVVIMRPQTLDLILSSRAAKGDVLAVARVAGIIAAKRTGEIIPLCHPLPLDAVTIELTPRPPDRVQIMAAAAVSGRTGVEMEALTAAGVAALTIYDMCKAVDKDMVVSELRRRRRPAAAVGTTCARKGRLDERTK